MATRPLKPAVLAGLVVLVAAVEQAAEAQPRIRFAARTGAAAEWQSREKRDSASTTKDTARSSNTASRPAPPANPRLSDEPSRSETLTSLPALSTPLPIFDPYEAIESVGPEMLEGDPAGLHLEPTYRFRIIGEYLFLAPGGAAATEFATPVYGATPPPILVATGTTDHDYGSAFRAGLGFQTAQRAEWVALYTYLDNETSAAFSVPPGGVGLRGRVLHPSTSAAAANMLNATANSHLNLQLGDLEYRGHLLDDTCSLQGLSYVVGGRYVRLDQDFAAQFSSPTAAAGVESKIEFQGGGIRLGLDGQRRSERWGLLVYGRGIASLIAGEFSSSYTQRDSTATVEVSGEWQDDRVVPILDLEIGAGWTSPRERFLLSAGYQFSAWYNVVSHAEFIAGVRNASFEGVGDTLVFNGPVVRAEIRF